MRRANGEGSIYKTSTGFVAQYYDPSNKRRSKSFKTMREARQFLTEQKSAMDTGTYVVSSDMLFSQWWDDWIDVYKKRSISINSLESYGFTFSRIKRLYPSLLRTRLGDIKRSHVQRLINLIDDAGLSRRTAELSWVHVKGCLQQALIDNMIPVNPALKVTLPSEHDKEEKKARALSDADKEVLLKAIREPVSQRPNDRRHCLDVLLFLLHTGCRIGEALALTWHDIDLPAMTASINKSVDIKHRVSRTKTGESGDVPLTKEVTDMLIRRKFLGTELVFTSKRKKPLWHRNVYRIMKQVLPDHTIHDLRHTLITDLVRAGVHPKIIQSLVRHKSPDMIMKVYAHVEHSDKRSAIDQLALQIYCRFEANADEKTKTENG